MKIGIITFHCSYNYGSALQAYALQEYLEEIGHEAKIIHFMSPDFEIYKLFHPDRGIVKFIKDVILLPRNLRIRNAFQGFWKRYFHLTKKYTMSSNMEELNNEFDAFICGSDQIWNLDCTQGIVPQFFLSFSKKRSIAYAPSLAHTEFSVRFDENELRSLLDKFYAISVREKETEKFIAQYTSKPVHTVIDPTLLLPKERYEQICVKNPFANKKFILCYMLEMNNDLVRYVAELSERKGLQVVYFSKRRMNYKRKWINAFGVGPAEWLSLIKNAEYVVGNSFHAVVFSILFRKQFQVFLTKWSSSRMQGLLTTLHLEARIYSSGASIDAPIEFDNAEHLLQDYVAQSKKYLKWALE